MKLAVNYSPQTETLRTAGTVQVDTYKCPDWPDLIAQARDCRPVYVHFPLNAGDGSLANVDWETVERLLVATSTPYVNLHLVAQAADFPDLPVDTADPAHLETVATRFLQDITSVVRRFGPERIIVENVIYRGPEGKVLYAAVAPEVIARVVAESGCGLLLDMSHASISARHIGISAQEYLGRLPVNRLCELHVTGTQHDGQRWRDHMGLAEHDWALLDWIAGRIGGEQWAKPWAMAFEYGGVGPVFAWRSDPAVIAEQVPRLYQIVQSLQ